MSNGYGYQKASTKMVRQFNNVLPEARRRKEFTAIQEDLGPISWTIVPDTDEMGTLNGKIVVGCNNKLALARFIRMVERAGHTVVESLDKNVLVVTPKQR